MTDNLMDRRSALLGMAGVAALAGTDSALADAHARAAAQNLDLNDPVDLSYARQKVIGSVEKERIDTFLRFHFYGQIPGEQAVPLLSMNNYIVDYWEPVERGTYRLRHYEVGYYTEFDTDKPLDVWSNPITGEDIEVFHFILGPIEREYSPERVIAPGLAPNPLASHVMGNRLFVATEAISRMPNIFQPADWPKRSSGEMVNWVSMQTLSADYDDVLNPQLSSAPAHIQLQNFVSWSSWMQMGQRPGGTMARAYGTEIDGFDSLPPEIQAGFRKYTPEILATEDWTDVRFDELDYFQMMKARREAGEA